MSEPYADRLSVFRSLTPATVGVDLKGMTMPSTSMNGNMFAFLSKSGVGQAS